MLDNRLIFFALKVVSLFFLLLFLLYWMLPVYNFFLSMPVEMVMSTVYPRFIHTISANKELIEIVTNFSIAGQSQSRLGFDMNPLKYAYGLPLFIALLLSSNGQWRDNVWHIMIGIFVLLIAQTWSLCFDITRNLLFEFQGVYSHYFEYSALAKSLVSLGSQLGFLLFPTLIPIALWILLMPDFFKQLTRQQ